MYSKDAWAFIIDYLGFGINKGIMEIRRPQTPSIDLWGRWESNPDMLVSPISLPCRARLKSPGNLDGSRRSDFNRPVLEPARLPLPHDPDLRWKALSNRFKPSIYIPYKLRVLYVFNLNIEKQLEDAKGRLLSSCYAPVAQSVERCLGKAKVASSILAWGSHDRILCSG